MGAVTNESTGTGTLRLPYAQRPALPRPVPPQQRRSSSVARDGVGRGQATAKFILVGEHAVVYGRPALALPMPSLTMDAVVTPARGSLFLDSEHYRGPVLAAPERLAPVRAAIDATLKHLGLPASDLVIQTDSAIPIERGLGSSAAVSGAVVRALFDLLGRTPSAVDLFSLIQVSERVAHGSPSGLDAHAVTARGPLRFEYGVATPLPFSLEATFILADTGVRGQTRAAVRDLATLRDAHQSFVDGHLDQITEITRRTELAIQRNELEELGALMIAAHDNLQALGVSSAELDTLVAAAVGAGAYGAKLTGGGRGGCMVAVARTPEQATVVAEALRDAGATATWLYTTGTLSV